jgi:hypothetical protein
VPFLRVIRDKRGYETTYLMHWYREGNRQRSRILYVFRSPGGVRVGRDPLEPDILRTIEAQHPDIEFDWKVVRENQQIIEPLLEQRRRRPRTAEGGEAPVARPAEPAPPPVRPAVPATIDGDTPDAQIAFLVQLYPTVRERIQQRILEPARQETLYALAERLNPAMWTDADQITTGLQQAAEALERLSHVFAKRRRRKKKPRPAGQAIDHAETAAADATEPDVTADLTDSAGRSPSAIPPDSAEPIDPEN